MAIRKAVADTWERMGLSLGLVCVFFLLWDGVYKHHLGPVELAIDLSAPVIAFGIIVGFKLLFDRYVPPN